VGVGTWLGPVGLLAQGGHLPPLACGLELRQPPIASCAAQVQDCHGHAFYYRVSGLLLPGPEIGMEQVRQLRCL